ncbi:MAG: substrate-binding domain-containing protein [Clostridia bacterium]|nr:substrate-binding domain-containing protein [Clostridia bacterium]
MKMKKLLCIVLACLLAAVPALAENPDTGSWSQINQAVSRKEGWQRVVSEEDERFQLGDITPLEGSEGLYIAAYGAYPSMDGSTVCVPMAMELARQWLNLEEGDMNGFVNFSTTPYAYDRLIQGKANPLSTIKSQGVMMDDTHPIDLILATYPNADERQEAADAGVELVYVPFCYDAFVFLVNDQNPVDSLTVRQIQEIYAGNVLSWSQVGGENRVVDAYQRPHGSGSQTAMEEMVMKGAPIMRANENFISDGMADAVQQVGNYSNGQSAIGYSYLYYVNALVESSGVKVLAVDGVTPDDENLQSGAYPFTVNYYAVYRAGDENTAAFVDWLVSDAGQEAVRQAGYVTLR